MTAETHNMTTQQHDTSTTSNTSSRGLARMDKRTHRLSPPQRLQLLRDWAGGGFNQSELSDVYGISQSAISQYIRKHAVEVEELRNDMDNPFSGLAYARKYNRIALYEDEIERLSEVPNADHHEWSKARQMAARYIAEELGDLPPRATVMVVPVTHIVENVNLEELK